MAERRARELAVEVGIVIVTPEPEPLGVFGHMASNAIAELLAARGIEIRVGARAHEGVEGEIVLDPGGERLDTGAVVALPELHGPAVPGLPADERGFIPIGEHAEVQNAPDVYAAGDGTNFPIKHGGIGTQQADAAAEHIAARAGAAVDPAPFRPVIRGRLIAGDEYINLQADIAGGGGEGVRELRLPLVAAAEDRRQVFDGGAHRAHGPRAGPAARARDRGRGLARERVAPRSDGARPLSLNTDVSDAWA